MNEVCNEECPICEIEARSCKMCGKMIKRKGYIKDDYKFCSKKCKAMYIKILAN